MSHSTRIARFPLDGLLGRYLLSLLARPFAASLLVLLPALLMERLLRLFDLIAAQNVPGGAIMRMLADLVPHYLGLALPASLFVGVYFVISSLAATNELDAMQNTGCSLRWISRPLIMAGLVTAIAGFCLYGYLQPYARYAYRAAFAAATQGAWNATIPPGEITRVSKDIVVTADRTDRFTGRLKGVVLHQRDPSGVEKVTTARTGELQLSPDGTQLQLRLEHVTQIETGTDDTVSLLTTPNAQVNRPYVIQIANFRPRGIDEREMTLNELWTARQQPNPTIPRRQLDGELHSRLVRSLSLAMLPLLAVPFGLGAKRSRRQYGVVFGVLILVVYYHAIQLVQSFGAAGFIDPRPALWAAFIVFCAACIAAFHRAESRTSEGPMDAAFAALDRGADAVMRTVNLVRERFA